MIFRVRQKRWSHRAVACRVAMCLGTGDPLAWDENDEGAPFWDADNKKFQLDSGNNWWLRFVEERDGCMWYMLDYRYTTPERNEVIKSLAKWLESDLVFGLS